MRFGGALFHQAAGQFGHFGGVPQLSQGVTGKVGLKVASGVVNRGLVRAGEVGRVRPFKELEKLVTEGLV